MVDVKIAYIVGFATCMICDVLFSVTDFFIQKAFYYRELRKKSHDCVKGSSVDSP